MDNVHNVYMLQNVFILFYYHDSFQSAEDRF